MDNDTFDLLVLKIAPILQKQNTVMRATIRPAQKFKATFRFLVSGQSFNDLRFSTRISEQILGKIVIETCEAIISKLKEYIM